MEELLIYVILGARVDAGGMKTTKIPCAEVFFISLFSILSGWLFYWNWFVVIPWPISIFINISRHRNYKITTICSHVKDNIYLIIILEQWPTSQMICLLFLLKCSVFEKKKKCSVFGGKRLLLNDQDIMHQMQAEIQKLRMEIQVQHNGKCTKTYYKVMPRCMKLF